MRSTCAALIVSWVFASQEGQGNGANYKGSVDMKAELGRTQAKVNGWEVKRSAPERLLGLDRMLHVTQDNTPL